MNPPWWDRLTIRLLESSARIAWLSATAVRATSCPRIAGRCFAVRKCRVEHASREQQTSGSGSCVVGCVAEPAARRHNQGRPACGAGWSSAARSCPVIHGPSLIAAPIPRQRAASDACRRGDDQRARQSGDGGRRGRGAPRTTTCVRRSRSGCGHSQLSSVIEKALPSGSRNANIAGTSGQRRISSVSTPAAWSLACAASASSVVKRMLMAPRF